MKSIYKKLNKIFKPVIIGLFCFILFFVLQNGSRAGTESVQEKNGFELEKVTLTNDFKISELPEMEFEFKKKRTGLSWFGAAMKGVFVDEYKIVEVDYAISDFADFAKEQGVNYKILKLMNPWLRQSYLRNSAGKTYQVKIPTKGYYSLSQQEGSSL